MSEAACAHIGAIATVKHAARRECAECVRTHGRWVHLRTCQECGTTLCCDDSPNRHASKHAALTSHPVIASAEPGERWLYCFPDDAFAEYERPSANADRVRRGPRRHAAVGGNGG